MKKASFSETEKNIMNNKIDFLQNQLTETIKKRENLEMVNQNLRNAIVDLTNDKTQIISIIHGERQLDHSTELKNKDIEIKSLKSKLEQSNKINEQYKRELHRMQKNMTDHIQSIQLSFEREKKQYQKRIEFLQMNLKKKQTTQIDLEDLQSENSHLKKKLSRRNQSQLNTSQLQLQYVIKALDKRDTTFTLEDIQNISINRVPTQTDYSSTKSKSTLTKSKSRLSERKVISSLYCELCQHNYAPNQYYKHLSQHGEKGRLMLQKLQIERKLKQKTQRRKLQDELILVTSALKDHEKRHCISSKAIR